MPFTHLFVARKLKFYQLVVLDQVLQSGSLLHAAKALSLTQPAVTKIIHELESYFNAPLLVRSNRGVSATALGDLLARRGRSLLTELSLLTDEVNAFQNGTSGHILVGSLVSASGSLLPRALHLLKQRAPDVRVSIRLGQLNQMFPALIMGQLDLIVGRLPDDWHSRHEASKLKATVLYTEKLSIVAGAHHPLSNVERVSMETLHGYPWILPTRDSPHWPAVEALFHKTGLSIPSNIVESLSILTNISLIQDQKTIAVMPQNAADQFAGRGILAPLALGTQLKFGDIGYIHAHGRELRPTAVLLRKCLELAADEREE